MLPYKFQNLIYKSHSSQIVLFTYTKSCDCLIQVWLVYLIRIPAYFYIAGSPLFHFAIMIERVLATIFVRIYENKGKKIAVISTIIVVDFLTFNYLKILISNVLILYLLLTYSFMSAAIKNFVSLNFILWFNKRIT